MVQVKNESAATTQEVAMPAMDLVSCKNQLFFTSIAGLPYYDSEKCKDIVTNNCTQGVGEVYGTNTSFAYQGSGGAGSSAGKGGGIVWLHASDTLSVNGTIEARGGHSQTAQGATYGSGGGSGGSISITTNKISGTGDSMITVAGGNGRQRGGGGGGGWIYGKIIGSDNNNTFDGNSTLNWFGRYNVSAGFSIELANSDALLNGNTHSGKISHAPCLPGYEGVF